MRCTRSGWSGTGLKCGYTDSEESQFDWVRRLQDRNALTREVAQLFHEVRRAGNDANHALKDDYGTALASLKLTWQLSLWFHRTFSDPAYRSGPFIPPKPPINESEELKAELARLQQSLHHKTFIRRQELDPSSRQKTLIFCVTDGHADIVVEELKKAFKNQYGSIDDDAVIKITGAADKPLELIRKFKNERNPNVAVTVDLLTTGVDVPEICNIVFIRRVNSRILFDQMIGRGTRLCEEVGKESFRFFDAVRIYEALQNLTEMKPVVVDPKISFTQMEQELRSYSWLGRPAPEHLINNRSAQSDTEKTANPDWRDANATEIVQLVRDQFAAKLQRKKRHLPASAVDDFETLTGMEINRFVETIREMTPANAAVWFRNHPGIGEILDRKSDKAPDPIYISDHPDQLVSIERGYGQASKPKDFLDEFSKFIKSHQNEIPALLTVMTRPRELTRKQLRELALELDEAGFSEKKLTTAWREMTNQDIAARIVGFIRQAAVGDTLLPYELRVENALQKVLETFKEAIWQAA